MTPLKFTTSCGAVCRTNVQMMWIPHVHRKPKYDKRTEYLHFLDLGVLTCYSVSARPHAKESTTFMSTKQCQWVSREDLLISSNWRWHLLQRIVHILHFFTNLGIGSPLNVEGPGCSPVSTPLNPSLIITNFHSELTSGKGQPWNKFSSTGFLTFLRSRTTWTPHIVNAHHIFQNN